MTNRAHKSYAEAVDSERFSKGVEDCPFSKSANYTQHKHNYNCWWWVKTITQLNNTTKQLHRFARPLLQPPIECMRFWMVLWAQRPGRVGSHRTEWLILYKENNVAGCTPFPQNRSTIDFQIGTDNFLEWNESPRESIAWTKINVIKQSKQSWDLFFCKNIGLGHPPK